MGKEERVQSLNLDVKVPSFFRCPISLDVMRSPVSLCTGVTYDRSSIQRWLDTGKKTCPATNQPLPSTDLIPNLTLLRLIELWSATASASADSVAGISSSSDPSRLLLRLADFFLDADNDDFEKNAIVGCAGEAVSSLLIQNAGEIEILQAAANVLAVILTTDFIEEKNKNVVIASLISDLNASVSALLFVLKEGKTGESSVDAARILCAILLSSDSNSKASIAEKSDLIPELIRLIGQEKMHRDSIDAGIDCLIEICGVRGTKLRMVNEGIVPAVVKVMKAEDFPAMEKAIKLLESASGIAEGRSEICKVAEDCLGALLRRMMKVGKEGMEAAAVVLWSVCYRFQDRRAVEAVKAENGGVMKILLLMQSNCSPAVRQMSGDLLKIFRVNTKGCLAGYDTKTTHIMPF